MKTKKEIEEIKRIARRVEEIHARKMNYWRGFRACMILIVAPLVLGIIVLLNLFIKIYG